MKRFYWIAPILLVLALAPAAAFAQDSEESAPAAGVTTGDPEVALNELKLLLAPLTKDELEAEVNAWMAMLQAKVREVSEKKIAILKAEGDAKTQLQEEDRQLFEETEALISRVNTVLAAFRDKGGDIEVFKMYIAEIPGLEVDVTDVSATWTTILNWLKSKEGGIRWGTNIALFLFTLFAFWILSLILGGVTRRAVSKLKKTSELLRDFFVNSAKKITIFIGIVIALSMLEVEIGPFLAAIGVVGFVVGFALQNTLSNFASGIMLLIYRPYDIGDVVNAAGVLGKVDAMTLVSTTIKTFDNQDVIVPNSSIWGGIINNITANDIRRVDMTFGIGYGDDIDKAQSILEDIVKNHPLVLKEPEYVIKLHELGDSSVNFVVRPWSKGSDYWAVYWDVTKAVKERFDKEGVTIPFPQRDVHIYQKTGSKKKA